MSKKERIEITCPHCRRSYALRIDPEKLKSTGSMARCGRCSKRFSLSMRVTALLEDAETSELEPARVSFRKRITKPVLRKRHSTDPEPAVTRAAEPVDISEINVTLEPESREGLDVAYDHAWQKAVAAVQAMQEAIITHVEEPHAEEHAPEAYEVPDPTPDPPRAATPFAPQPAAPPHEPPPRRHDTPQPFAAQPSTAQPSQRSTPPAKASAPPRSSGAPPHSSGAPGSSKPPTTSTVPPLSKRVTAAMSRQAWLELADQDLQLLVPERTTSVRALEWLLGEDALREG